MTAPLALKRCRNSTSSPTTTMPFDRRTAREPTLETISYQEQNEYCTMAALFYYLSRSEFQRLQQVRWLRQRRFCSAAARRRQSTPIRAGTLGSPIIKNKLFFFFNYEGARANTTTFSTGYVETPIKRRRLACAWAGRSSGDDSWSKRPHAARRADAASQLHWLCYLTKVHLQRGRYRNGCRLSHRSIRYIRSDKPSFRTALEEVSTAFLTLETRPFLCRPPLRAISTTLQFGDKSWQKSIFRQCVLEPLI